MITFDFKTYRNNIINDAEIVVYEAKLKGISSYFEAHQNMMGWAKLKQLTNLELISDIVKTSSYIRNNCDVFLVVGIGGSYLGSLAVIEALNPYFYNNTRRPEIYYVGNSLSSEYIIELKELIKSKNIIVNYISKSGKTFETDLAYKLIFELMQEKYTIEEIKTRIIFTTGEVKAVGEGYKNFEIPANVGGRFSVFTPVGLLPIAVAGINIEDLLRGAIDSQKTTSYQMRYAIIRDIMSNKEKQVEAFVAYEPKLTAFIEWLKQLYAESLGKDEKGLLPIGVINTRDLHSVGQYFQAGSKILFETVFNVTEVKKDIMIDRYQKSLNEINNIASTATSMAHYKVNVLNNIINLDKLDAYNMGYLLQFFMISCAISGYLEGVNAFNQDGVEEYKKIMRDLIDR